jgi:hypothetical protein
MREHHNHHNRPTLASVALTLLAVGLGILAVLGWLALWLWLLG